MKQCYHGRGQDEGAAMLGGDTEEQSPEAAIAFLAEKADIAAVTLGARGCFVRQVGREATLEQPAAGGVTVVDATGVPQTHLMQESV